MAMARWGALYRNTQTYKHERHTQSPMYAKEGKEETVEYLGKFSQAFRNSIVTKKHPYENIFGAYWCYGYDSALHRIAPTPNGAPMTKTLLAGNVRWIMLPMSKLAPFLRTLAGMDDILLNDLTKLVANTSATDFAQLAAQHSCQPLYVEQQPLDTVFVPAGWIVLEHVQRGVLIYGVRKSWLLESNGGARDYEELIGAYKDSEKLVSIMQKVLEFIDPAAEEDDDEEQE